MIKFDRKASGNIVTIAPAVVRSCKWLLFIVCLLICVKSYSDSNSSTIGEGVKQLPIFDAHIHYKAQAWERYPVESVIELMDQSGVAMGLVSSTPDQGTIKLWEHAPNRIVPELRPYYGDVGSSNWTKADNISRYIEKRLELYPHEGIGEFHIHRLDTSDESLFREIIEMAKSRDINLHVHSGADAIRWLYSLDREVKIIWAHAGLVEPASAVYALMKEFPELYADTSLREYDILGNGENINHEWKQIIMEFQDRLMVGSDTWVNSQWDVYANIISSNRKWLSMLPKHVAEKIAYKNAEVLFNRKVSMALIGTK